MAATLLKVATGTIFFSDKPEATVSMGAPAMTSSTAVPTTTL
jgi:hypothetical protein